MIDENYVRVSWTEVPLLGLLSLHISGISGGKILGKRSPVES